MGGRSKSNIAQKGSRSAPAALRLRRYRLSVQMAGLISVSGAAYGVVDAAQLSPPANVKVDFARDIRPILERSCIRCHGPEKPKSGFRLDNRAAALKGGENGKDILPGDSANSLLIQVVAGLSEDVERMPPKGKGDPLTSEEISLLRSWIDQGVQWPETIGGP